MPKLNRVTGIYLGANIARRMALSKELKTQEALGRRAGIAQTTIGRIIRGDQTPSTDYARRIAAAFGVSVEELHEDPDMISAVTARSNFTPTHGVETRIVPVISWLQAGKWGELVDTFKHDDANEWLPCAGCSRRTFAARVEGESMLPRFKPGDVIFVDPEVEAVNGKFVIAHIPALNETTFKQLIIEGNERRLKALNPDWQPRFINITNEEVSYSGVVIWTGSPV